MPTPPIMAEKSKMRGQTRRRSRGAMSPPLNRTLMQRLCPCPRSMPSETPCFPSSSFRLSIISLGPLRPPTKLAVHTAPTQIVSANCEIIYIPARTRSAYQSPTATVQVQRTTSAWTITITKNATIVRRIWMTIKAAYTHGKRWQNDRIRP